eukprot:TRINITY_DN6706_c0_g1_i2.p1 TRINITY_DN6706_c0_g1~~TRINITY_DN6706_c0_g1_i2.p1  ORF type:complete len:1015 (-),score=261.14 TRINITY_DN6706_c0_g1_i2:20-3064(-)
MFRDVAAELARIKTVPGAHMQVRMSYLEIYNERIRDLLARQKSDKYGSLAEMDIKILHKEDGTTHFYRKDGLNTDEKTCTYAINSISDLQNYYNIGTTHRSVACTKMNGHSSRSHTIVCLHITRREGAGRNETAAQLFLVDLAGAENAAKTGAVGTQAAEAAAINTSLLELGNVINAKAEGRKVTTYRNSQLTMMLKTAIGGNSYTVMFGAIGPSSYNVGEIKSTLEYCSRASTIKCKSVAAVQASSAIVTLSDLRKENQLLSEERDRLNKMLTELKSAVVSPEASGELERVRQELAEKEAMLERQAISVAEAQLSEEQIVAEMKRRAESQLKSLNSDLQQSGVDMGNTTLPLLVNLHRDHTVDGAVRYAIAGGDSTLGSDPQANKLVVIGFGVKRQHATLINTSGQLVLVPIAGAETRVNGKLVKDKTRLQHNDRVCFGENLLFRVDMRQQDVPAATWTAAMREIAIGRGLFKEAEFEHDKEELRKAQRELEQLKTQLRQKSNDDSARTRLMEVQRNQKTLEDKISMEADLVHYLEQARIATGLAQQLNLEPEMVFEPQVVTRRTNRGAGFKHQIVIKATCTGPDDTRVFVWPTAKFEDLLHYLQEVQVRELHGELAEPLDDLDRIGLNIDQEYGQVIVFLKPLTHLLAVEGDDDDNSPSQQVILSSSGKQVGHVHLRVSIDAGEVEEHTEMVLLDASADDVVAVWRQWAKEQREVKIRVEIHRAEGIVDDAVTGCYCRFTFGGETCKTEVSKRVTTQPVFDFDQTFQLRVTDELIEQLRDGSLNIDVCYQAQAVPVRRTTPLSPLSGVVTDNRNSRTSAESARSRPERDVSTLRRQLSTAAARWTGQLWRRKAAERKVLKLIQVMGTLGTPLSPDMMSDMWPTTPVSQTYDSDTHFASQQSPAAGSVSSPVSHTMTASPASALQQPPATSGAVSSSAAEDMQRSLITSLTMIDQLHKRIAQMECDARQQAVQVATLSERAQTLQETNAKLKTDLAVAEQRYRDDAGCKCAVM